MSPARTASKKTEAGQAADDKPTLMLLDGNSLAFRAFYALPAENFKTQGGLTTNAVYGFTAMLINLLRDESPTHVAAAFDVSRQTFRSERYPEYKANRSSTPDEFHGQIDVTKEVLAALWRSCRLLGCRSRCWCKVGRLGGRRCKYHSRIHIHRSRRRSHLRSSYTR